MLRLLVADITVRRNEGQSVTLQVRWTGGACEEISLTLPAPMADRWRYRPEIIEEVRRLAETKVDEQIVAVFNERGQKSSHGRAFTKAMIQWIRYKHNVPAPNLKCTDELTVGEVAEKFGVSTNVVHYWIERNVITTRQLCPGRPHWITLTPEKELELTSWVQRSKRITKTAAS